MRRLFRLFWAINFFAIFVISFAWIYSHPLKDDFYFSTIKFEQSYIETVSQSENVIKEKLESEVIPSKKQDLTGACLVSDSPNFLNVKFDGVVGTSVSYRLFTKKGHSGDCITGEVKHHSRYGIAKPQDWRVTCSFV